MLLESESRRGAWSQCCKSIIRQALTADINIDLPSTTAVVLYARGAVVSEGKYVVDHRELSGKQGQRYPVSMKASMLALRHPLNGACSRSLPMAESQYIRQLLCLFGFLEKSSITSINTQRYGLAGGITWVCIKALSADVRT